jgi:hypothetical protein
VPTVPFTATQITAIRYYAGYTAYAAFGYVLSPEMATLDTQLAAMSDSEQTTVVTEFLNVLPGLKTAIDTASATLMVGKAGPFTRNPAEMSERMAQYNNLRRRMCAFIGCVPGDALRRGGSVVRA